jgi:hypothetical protein
VVRYVLGTRSGPLGRSRGRFPASPDPPGQRIRLMPLHDADDPAQIVPDNRDALRRTVVLSR